MVLQGAPRGGLWVAGRVGCGVPVRDGFYDAHSGSAGRMNGVLPRPL